MTLDEAMATLTELEGHFAYELGALDSGVHDEDRKRVLLGKLGFAPLMTYSAAVARFVRENYLSARAQQQGYGPEDAREFLRWLAVQAVSGS